MAVQTDTAPDPGEQAPPDHSASGGCPRPQASRLELATAPGIVSPEQAWDIYRRRPQPRWWG
jgi:hypothetical protein